MAVDQSFVPSPSGGRLGPGRGNDSEPLIRVENLQKHFPVTQGLIMMKTIGHVQAVDGISFTIDEGKTLGLVGESGCGKTTTSKLLLRIERPTGGQIKLYGEDIQDFRGEKLKEYRTTVGAVFQDPWSSLSPRMRVRDIVAESLVVNRGEMSREEMDERVAEVLEQVGLHKEQAHQYPPRVQWRTAPAHRRSQRLSVSPQADCPG